MPSRHCSLVRSLNPSPPCSDLMDNVSAEVRSRIMARIKDKNTAPEVAVRRAMHAAGLRFRLHRRNLPGTPDIAFPRYRTVIFVHGCFWHRHTGCRYSTLPATNREMWREKFRKNRLRDASKERALRQEGWKVLVIWECEIGDSDILRRLAESIKSINGIPKATDLKRRRRRN